MDRMDTSRAVEIDVNQLNRDIRRGDWETLHRLWETVSGAKDEDGIRLYFKYHYKGKEYEGGTFQSSGVKSAFTYEVFKYIFLAPHLKLEVIEKMMQPLTKYIAAEAQTYPRIHGEGREIKEAPYYNVGGFEYSAKFYLRECREAGSSEMMVLLTKMLLEHYKKTDAYQKPSFNREGQEHENKFYGIPPIKRIVESFAYPELKHLWRPLRKTIEDIFGEEKAHRALDPSFRLGREYPKGEGHFQKELCSQLAKCCNDYPEKKGMPPIQLFCEKASAALTKCH